MIARLFRQNGVHSCRLVLCSSIWRIFTVRMIKSVKVFAFSFWKLIMKRKNCFIKLLAWCCKMATKSYNSLDSSSFLCLYSLMVSVLYSLRVYVICIVLYVFPRNPLKIFGRIWDIKISFWDYLTFSNNMFVDHVKIENPFWTCPKQFQLAQNNLDKA